MATSDLLPEAPEGCSGVIVFIFLPKPPDLLCLYISTSIYFNAPTTLCTKTALFLIYDLFALFGVPVYSSA